MAYLKKKKRNVNRALQLDELRIWRSAEKTKKEPKDIRDFDYTGRSWTGKSPKQFLIDWGRKNLPKSPAPSFQKIPAGRYWKCKWVK